MTETKRGVPFKLRRASFKGKGLRADARGARWRKLRDLAYEGHEPPLFEHSAAD